ENVAPLSVDLEKKISPIPDRVSCQATLIASSSETAITGAKPSPAEFDMLTGSVKVMPRSVERMATTCFAPLCVLTQATYTAPVESTSTTGVKPPWLRDDNMAGRLNAAFFF